MRSNFLKIDVIIFDSLNIFDLLLKILLVNYLELFAYLRL